MPCGFVALYHQYQATAPCIQTWYQDRYKYSYINILLLQFITLCITFRTAEHSWNAECVWPRQGLTHHPQQLCKTIFFFYRISCYMKSQILPCETQTCFNVSNNTFKVEELEVSCCLQLKNSVWHSHLKLPQYSFTKQGSMSLSTSTCTSAPSPILLLLLLFIPIEMIITISKKKSGS